MRLRWLPFAIVGVGCGSFGSSADPTVDPPNEAGVVDTPAEDASADTNSSVDGGAPAGDACAPPGFCERFTTPLDFGPDGGPWEMTRSAGGGVMPANTGPGGPNGSTKPSYLFSVNGVTDFAWITRKLRATQSVHCELDLIASTWAERANFFGATFMAQASLKRLDAYFGKRDGSIALYYYVESTGAPAVSDAPKAGANAQDWKHVVYDLELKSAPQLSAQLSGTTLMVTKPGIPTSGQEVEVDVRVGIFDQSSVGVGAAQNIMVDNIVCVPK